MRSQCVLVFALWFTVGVVHAQQHDQVAHADRAFLSGGVSVVVQPQETNFGGGYFCCDAGGVEPGLWVEAGWFVSNLFDIRGELSVPRAFTNELSAPRFIQENQHRDVTASAVVAFHSRALRRARPAVLAGFGAAFGRTKRTSRMLTFLPGGSIAKGDALVQETREVVPALMFGIETAFSVTARVRLIPQIRARWLWRSDQGRFEDGLARWSVAPQVGVQLLF